MSSVAEAAPHLVECETEQAREAYLPADVAEAFRALADPRELSAAAWTVKAALMSERRVGDEAPAAWAAEELALVEATERVKAWADSQQLAALRRLREAVFEELRHHNDDLAMAGCQEMPPSVIDAEADMASVDEVMLATGLPQAVVSRRMELARDADGAPC